MFIRGTVAVIVKAALSLDPRCLTFSTWEVYRNSPEGTGYYAVASEELYAWASIVPARFLAFTRIGLYSGPWLNTERWIFVLVFSRWIVWCVAILLYPVHYIELLHYSTVNGTVIYLTRVRSAWEIMLEVKWRDVLIQSVTIPVFLRSKFYVLTGDFLDISFMSIMMIVWVAIYTAL